MALLFVLCCFLFLTVSFVCHLLYKCHYPKNYNAMNHWKGPKLGVCFGNVSSVMNMNNIGNFFFFSERF